MQNMLRSQFIVKRSRWRWVSLGGRANGGKEVCDDSDAVMMNCQLSVLNHRLQDVNPRFRAELERIIFHNRVMDGRKRASENAVHQRCTSAVLQLLHHHPDTPEPLQLPLWYPLLAVLDPFSVATEQHQGPDATSPKRRVEDSNDVSRATLSCNRSLGDEFEEVALGDDRAFAEYH